MYITMATHLYKPYVLVQNIVCLGSSMPNLRA